MKIIQGFIAYAPDGAVLGTIVAGSDWNYSQPFNDVPALSFNIQDGKPGAELLHNPVEVAVETSIDGVTWTEKPNSRFLRIKRSVKAAGEDHVRQYTLPGYSWLLNKMRQWTTTGLNADGKRMFNSANAGMILRTPINENVALGFCTGVSAGFTTTLDSAGQPWNKVVSIGYEPGLDLFTILNNLADQGVVDWNFSGRTLNLYNADTTLAVNRDLVLQKGIDVKSMPVEGTLEEMAHEVLVLGDNGKRLKRTNASAVQYWGKWGAFVNQGGVSDTGTMNIFADSALSTAGTEAIQLTAELIYAKSNFNPLYDFNPGDYVNIRDDKGVLQNYRVRGINFTRDAQGQRKVDLVLNDRMIEKSIRNARRVNGISGGAQTKGSGTAPAPDTGKRKPATPTGMVGDSFAYIDTNLGVARATLSFTYPGVTVDVNGVAIEIDRYEFRGQKVGTTTWRDFGRSTDLDHQYSPVVPAEKWNVQQRAVSANGVSSSWSTAVLVTAANDLDAPPKTSAPSITSRLGTITIRWNGLTDVGTAMPKDLHHVDVYQLGTALPIANIVDKNVPVVLTEVVIGSSYEIFFKAVDRAGNVGPESDHVTQTVASIMDDPQAALDINQNVEVVSPGSTKITYSSAAPVANGNIVGDTWWQISSGTVIGYWRWDGSVWQPMTLANQVISTLDAGKITTGTLLAARIASGAITADKIAAGAIDATKISADAIDGKTITGATITGGTISGNLFRTGTSGARTQIDTNGRQRIWLTDGSLFLDINPTITSQNALINGGLRLDALNLRDPGTSSTIAGIMIATSAAFSITSSGDRNVDLQAGGDVTMNGDAVSSLTIGQRVLTGANVGAIGINASNGIMGLLGSTRRFKRDIEDHFFSGNILDLVPRSWLPIDPKSNNDDLQRNYGLIAEEVEEAGFSEFVGKNDQGEVITLAYERLWLPLVPVVRRHNAELDLIKDRLERLEQKVT